MLFLFCYNRKDNSFDFNKLTKHCRFKGNTTSTTTYTPTAEEKEMMALSNELTKKYMPNAERLNNTAANILWDSIGSNQVDFSTLNDRAQSQISGAQNGIQGLLGSNNAATESANGVLSSLTPQYVDATTKANAQIASLANGVLPTAYQENMQNAINSTLQNTMGSALNTLGQRGVLNSSVTNTAMNDISKNAADTVAKSYGENIDRVAGLTGQQYENTLGALGVQGDMSQTQLQNTLGTNATNAGLYGNLIDSATAGISTGAAAQEAAQQPALNLWTASLGLSPAGSGALAAVSGKGTTTSTQSQSGGGFWGGLASGIGGGLVGLFCFIGGTKIDTPHGKVKIRNIKKGDKVISYNPETGNDEITEVVKVSEACLEKVYTVQTKDKYGQKHYAVTTASQPFMRPDGSYVTVEKMIVDHTELMGVGMVENIGYSGKQPVYDICTDKYHNYYANGFIAQDGSEFWGKE